MLELKNPRQGKLQEGSTASEQMEEPVNSRGAVGTTWEPRQKLPNWTEDVNLQIQDAH